MQGILEKEEDIRLQLNTFRKQIEALEGKIRLLENSRKDQLSIAIVSAGESSIQLFI
jgi:hypothetical protein